MQVEDMSEIEPAPKMILIKIERIEKKGSLYLPGGLKDQEDPATVVLTVVRVGSEVKFVKPKERVLIHHHAVATQTGVKDLVILDEEMIVATMPPLEDIPGPEDIH